MDDRPNKETYYIVCGGEDSDLIELSPAQAVPYIKRIAREGLRFRAVALTLTERKVNVFYEPGTKRIENVFYTLDTELNKLGLRGDQSWYKVDEAVPSVSFVITDIKATPEDNTIAFANTFGWRVFEGKTEKGWLAPKRYFRMHKSIFNRLFKPVT